MSASDADMPSHLDVNPYSPTAVARVTAFDDGETVTIETSAIREALGAVRAFVSETGAAESELAGGSTGQRARGRILAIVGDYGTGKTHLVIRLLRDLSENNTPDNMRGIYLDAAAENFLAVYRRFIDKLSLEEIEERVKAYYAEIVASSLLEGDLPDQVADQLRAGDFDPVEIVDRFALMEASLLGELRHRLREVTLDDQFGTALMLLLRRGFEQSVWSWLRGGQPDQILVERGITTWINDDVPALQAMGVIALLYGGQDHRFLLAIDELDKLLSATASPRAATLTAFKELLRVFSAAGAMLVLAGLPEFLQVAGRDVATVAQIVTMTPLTVDQTREFVLDSHQLTLGIRRLFPFTSDAVSYLVQISHGVARQIIRLCYHAYRVATDGQQQITTEAIRRVAVDQFYLPNIQEVRNAIRQVLDRNAWSYTPDHQVGESDRTVVDYWIAVSGSDSGCAVIAVESVVTVEAVTELKQRAAAIKEATPDSEVLLVVNGYLTVESSVELNSHLGTAPIVYEPRSFVESLDAALNALLQRITQLSGRAPAEVVSERVEQINRRQVTAQLSLEQLSGQIEDLRTVSDKRLDRIEDQIRTLAHAVSGTTAQSAAPAPLALAESISLPPEVERIFADALSGLGDLDNFDELLGHAFGTAGQGAAPDLATAGVIRTRLRSRENPQAVGIAVLLQKSIGTFRQGIESWYEAAELSGPDRERLNELCGAYDAVVEYLPPTQLALVVELTRAVDEHDGPGTWEGQQRDPVRAREILANLSRRVRNAVLRSTSDPA